MENRKYIYQKYENTTGVILLVNVFSVLHSVTDSNYPSGAFKPLVNVLSVLPWVTDYNYACRLKGEQKIHLPKVWKHQRGN
jgi:hypothetical protein